MGKSEAGMPSLKALLLISTVCVFGLFIRTSYQRGETLDECIEILQLRRARLGKSKSP
jgi:hypothetical protein